MNENPYASPAEVPEEETPPWQDFPREMAWVYRGLDVALITFALSAYSVFIVATSPVHWAILCVLQITAMSFCFRCPSAIMKRPDRLLGWSILLMIVSVIGGFIPFIIPGHFDRPSYLGAFIGFWSGVGLFAGIWLWLFFLQKLAQEIYGQKSRLAQVALVAFSLLAGVSCIMTVAMNIGPTGARLAGPLMTLILPALVLFVVAYLLLIVGMRWRIRHNSRERSEAK